MRRKQALAAGAAVLHITSATHRRSAASVCQHSYQSASRGCICQGLITALPPLTFASCLVSAVRSLAAEAEALILESAASQSE